MPDASELYGALGSEPVLFFCDHASNTIPTEFHQLGLGADVRALHIAYDIGAAALTRDLAARFKTRGVLSTFSRLVIDPNRAMDRDDLIPAVSDGVTIPGNQNLSASAREDRIEQYFEPYHRTLAREIDAARAQFGNPLFVSVHSFTPALMSDSQPRPWHVGVLWAHDEPTAKGFEAAMARHAPEMLIGDNKPYDAHGFNYTVDRHLKPLGARHLTLEVRQDLLEGKEKISAFAALLELTIRDLL